jgi:hypothetical protein
LLENNILTIGTFFIFTRVASARRKMGNGEHFTGGGLRGSTSPCGEKFGERERGAEKWGTAKKKAGEREELSSGNGEQKNGEQQRKRRGNGRNPVGIPL